MGSRLRLTCKPNVIIDIRVSSRSIKINNWAKCIQKRVKWKEVVEKAKTCK